MSTRLIKSSAPRSGARSNLVEVLRAHALERPGRRAYTFLADGAAGADGAESWTWAELDARARAIGAALARERGQGERALLLFPPGLDFIAAFFGCLYAGVVAVPCYPPRPRRDHPRLRAIARDARPRFVLTTPELAARREGIAEPTPELAAASWLVPAALEPRLGEEWDEQLMEETKPETPAFLQYTSGSTALPKGVIVTHGNILHNEEMIRAAFGQSEESVVVGWLPLYHDMGLIGNVLQPLCTGSSAVLMPPMAFLQRPARWLEAISRYRATTSGGPNFAYDLCVRKVTPEDRAALDLSSWSVAFNGAEPVRAATLERFAETFATCGFRREAFYPCYGLAEATLFVSGGQRGVLPARGYFDPTALEQGSAVPALPEESWNARALVGCGRAWDGQRIVVADPETGAAVPPGRVGEVWVAGPSVAGGYWDRPEETARTFGAVLAGSPAGGDRFLRTGDLGFFWDGELFVTGRLKDLIILRGRNLYPQDVELAAEASHPGLEPGGGAAFSVEVDGEERLVVVHEIARRFRPEPETVATVAAAVRRVVAEELEAQIHEVVLIRTGTLPRTSSGKVQRHACRAGYLAGDLEVVGRDAAAAVDGEDLQEGALPDREAFLRAELARAAGVDPAAVDPGRPPVELGLDSLAAVELSHRIETALGVSIPLTRWLEAPSLAAVLEGLNPSPPVPLSHPLPPTGRGENQQDVFPLSHGQRGLWFLERWAPAASAYNIPVPLRLRGDLDAAALFRAVEKMAVRHPALRTTFEEQGGEPVQRVHGRLEPETFFYKDAARWSEAELGEWLAREAWRPFDLGRGPLLRVALFVRGEQEHVLLLTIHHLIADFWSLAVLARELEALYRREIEGGEARLAAVSRTYADHVARERERLASGAEALWAYWGERLGGDLPALDLPGDRPRPALPTWRGGSAVLPLGVELSDGLAALARRRGATLFAALLAGFQTLLHRLTGQEDLIVGAPSAGRTSADLAGVVGYFIDTLPLRADLGGDSAFGDLLGRTAGVVSGALANPVPLTLLAERLHPERDPGRSPLFQTMLVLQRAHRPADRDWSAFALGEEGARSALADLAAESVRLAERRVPFDLTLMVAEEAGSHGLVASLQYALDLFDPAMAARIAGHFRTLLAAAVADPSLPLSELPLLSVAERRQVLVEWAEGPAIEPAPDRLLHELFLDQAARTPQTVALIAGEDRWTYADLAARSEAVADRLRALGVGPEDRVGICARRSPELVAGLLGILQAGGAYVPLDPAHPRPRLARILADARPAAVLVGEGLEEILPEHGAQRLALSSDVGEGLAPSREGASPSPTQRLIASDTLAYLIYTSGSTGEPKGVAIRHSSAVALVRWAWEVFPEADLHRVLASTSIGFDLSVFELFVPLSRGGAVVLAENVLALPELPAADEVTLVNTVPSALSTLLRTSGLPASVRTVNLAGEPLTRELAARLHELPQVERVFNLYGPSEDTTYSTFSLVERGEIPTIGRPLAGTRARVLDRKLQPVPPGVAGELCLGGAGLARGYLGRPELTAERWMPDAFAGTPGERLYRTGDLARFLPDGRLEFLGRIDHQVKVRGFRVEPGEIEAALVTHPGVGEAVVVARGEGGERRLVAFVIRQDERVDAPALSAFLQESLPAHLVPAAFSF
ncbi:MAG TPA: amino acid adenylation domain-containing protein, partial [Thermoanaerobaculia bacterium]|nr:amino acid adenylation domain-containing protein [Thermoanaerobaculia bacterium]